MVYEQLTANGRRTYWAYLRDAARGDAKRLTSGSPRRDWAYMTGWLGVRLLRERTDDMEGAWLAGRHERNAYEEVK